MDQPDHTVMVLGHHSSREPQLLVNHMLTRTNVVAKLEC
jgi:hypothetical protein